MHFSQTVAKRRRGETTSSSKPMPMRGFIFCEMPSET